MSDLTLNVPSPDDQPEQLTEDDLKAILKANWADAKRYCDDELAPLRDTATAYYNGEPFGNEEQGRSQVVMTEVRDTVHAIMPSLMRVFTGTEQALEFSAQGPDDTEQAKQATDYTRFVVFDLCEGFLALHAAFKDALVRKSGTLKWWWDTEQHERGEEYQGLTDDQLAQVANAPGANVVAVTSRPATPEELAALGAMAPAAGLNPAALSLAAAQAPPGAMPEALAQQAPPLPPSPQNMPQPEEVGPTGAAAGAPTPAGQAATPAPPGVGAQPLPQAPPPPPAPPTLHDVTVRYTTIKGVPRIAAVPPEEFLIARAARSVRSARYVAHRRLITQSELIALGYPFEQIDALPSFGGNAVSDETRRRNKALRTPTTVSANHDRSTRNILYVEHFLYVDLDGDGIAELVRVCTGGSDLELLHAARVPSLPFAVLCPDPEAHQVIGQCIADLTMDLQRIKSSVMRATLDSLAQAIFPRTAIVENQVNVEDALNTEAGGIIRMRQPGMVQELQKSFLGGDALGVIGYLDATREGRTGISRASQGLSAEYLQSTTPTAIQATVSASQDHIDMIARLFGETGLRDLYEGVLDMMARNQDRATAMLLRGKWVPVDPRPWLQKFKVRCTVGIGRGSAQERRAALAAIAGKQEQLLQTLGPSNPVVTVGQYANTIRSMVALAGWKDTGLFLNDLPTSFALPPPPQKPTTEEALLAVEKSKAQTAIAEATINAHSAEATHRLDDEQKTNAARADAVLRALELSFKYGQPVDIAAIAALFPAPMPDAVASALQAPPGGPPPPPPGPSPTAPPLGPPAGPPGLLNAPPPMPAAANG